MKIGSKIWVWIEVIIWTFATVLWFVSAVKLAAVDKGGAALGASIVCVMSVLLIANTISKLRTLDRGIVLRRKD